MRRRPQRIACLLAAAILALPAAAWGQSAGDEQYEDPFAPEPGQTEEGGSSGGGDTESSGGGSSTDGSSGVGSSGGGMVQPAATAAPEAAPPAPATTAAAGQQLPRTGGDIGLVALGGVVLLASGVALRVTLRERGPRRQ